MSINLNAFAKYIIISLLLFVSYNVNSYSQLKKVAKIEKIKSFTNGSVTLCKSTIKDTEVYSVTLPNASQYYKNIIFYLGDKETMLQNLIDLTSALETGKKGEIFEFQACGQEYSLAYSTVLGQKCFKVSEPPYVASDYGRFFKATIDDILKYFSIGDTQNSDETL